MDRVGSSSNNKEIRFRLTLEAKSEVPGSGDCNTVPVRHQSMLSSGYELILFKEDQDSTPLRKVVERIKCR